MEPWDGPAAVAFTDGRVIGATLDRNGLRPGRWLETEDGWVVLGSETGVLDEPAGQRQAQGPPAAGQAVPRRPRARPDRRRRRGQARGRRRQQPYGEWFERGHRPPRRPARRARRACRATEPLRDAPARVRLHAGGPAGAARADGGRRPRSRSARWATTSRWPCSRDRQPPLFTYFKQLFAQVTNPPIDPIREAIVMSVGTGVGSERNLLDETPEHAHQLVDADADPARPRAARSCARSTRSIFEAHTLDITWPVAEGPDGHGRARSSASAPRPTRRSPTASTS